MKNKNNTTTKKKEKERKMKTNGQQSPCSWAEVSVGQYTELGKILKEDGGDEADRNMRILSCLTRIPVEELYDTSLDDLREMQMRLSFIEEKPDLAGTPLNPDEPLVIGGREYMIVKDPSRMTYAQFTDFQVYWKRDENIAEVLSTIIAPKDGVYAKGYDPQKLIQEIKDSFPIGKATVAIGFFARCCYDLLRDCLSSLEQQAKMTETEKKTAAGKIQEIRTMLGL